jgi:undecaprenyl diphosphate synthase
MLGRLGKLFKGSRSTNLNLNHVGITLEGANSETNYSEKYKIPFDTLYEKKGQIINDLVKVQVQLDIPILSIFLLSNKKVQNDFGKKVEHLNITLKNLDLDFFIKNQIKIFPIGKWYELPSEILEEIKSLIEETKDFDKFFLNLCINYDGQRELEDVSKIIARKSYAQKIEVEEINKELIKDNLYTSYYPSPDLIIVNDTDNLQGFLTWDSAYSKISFTNKKWPEFSSQDFKRKIEKEFLC